MKKIFRIAAALFCILLLCPTLLLANLIQTLSLLFFFYPPLVRNINRAMCGGWFGLLRICVVNILRVQVIESGDTLPKGENAVVIVNHQSMTDIPCLIAIAWHSHMMQDMKWFVKDILKWVPGVGWGMLYLDCLFVKRNWAADKDKIERTFHKLRTNKIPFWMISFVEGTRITPAKKKRSQTFAQKNNYPSFEHVLLPRTKGFEATLNGLGERAKAVYDITIGYEGKAPKLRTLFFSTKRMHIHKKRYPLPLQEPAEAWVLQRFTEKDQRLAHFKEHNSF